MGLVRESRHADLIDIHRYPAHPQRVPAGSGGGGATEWRIPRGSMTGRRYGALESIARWRVAGKPFGVGEFDLNPPDDFNGETLTMFSTLAAYQGWDALAEYAWLNFQNGAYNPDRMRHPFATAGNPAQFATIPAAAPAFRQGLIEPARHRRTLTVPERTLREGGRTFDAVDHVWRPFGVTADDAWRGGLALRIDFDAATPSLSPAAAGAGAGAEPDPPPARPIVSDTDQLTLHRHRADATALTVNAPALRVAVGKIAGREHVLGGVTFRVGPAGPATPAADGFANVSLVALDGRPVGQSRRLLLTAVARVENAGSRFNAARTRLGPDWGAGPTLCEPVRLTVTLPESPWAVTALDDAGRPAGVVARHPTTFKLDERARALSSLVERAGGGAGLGAAPAAGPAAAPR